MAKPYGLADQNLCYIPVCISWRQRQRMFLRTGGEYGPRLIICDKEQFLGKEQS